MLRKTADIAGETFIWEFAVGRNSGFSPLHNSIILILCSREESNLNWCLMELTLLGFFSIFLLSCNVSDTHFSHCLSGRDYWPLRMKMCATVLWLVVSLAKMYLPSLWFNVKAQLYCQTSLYIISGNFVIWLNINSAGVIVCCCDICVKMCKSLWKPGRALQLFDAWQICSVCCCFGCFLLIQWQVG